MDQYLTTRSANKLGGPRPWFIVFPAFSAVFCYLITVWTNPGLGQVFVTLVSAVGGLISAMNLVRDFISRDRAVAIMRSTFKGQDLLEQGDKLELQTAEIEKRIRTYEESAAALETQCKTLLPKEFKEVDASFLARIGLSNRMHGYPGDQRKRLISSQTALLREICELHGLAMPETTIKKASA